MLIIQESYFQVHCTRITQTIGLCTWITQSLVLSFILLQRFMLSIPVIPKLLGKSLRKYRERELKKSVDDRSGMTHYSVVCAKKKRGGRRRELRYVTRFQGVIPLVALLRILACNVGWWAYGTHTHTHQNRLLRGA